MKVILNKCYGGFGVSDAAYRLYAEKKGIKIFAYSQKCQNGKWGFWRVDDVNENNADLRWWYFKKDFGKFALENEVDFGENLSLRDKYREDPVLVEVVEELGHDADGRYAHLVVVDIPDGMDYVIDEYDGIETLHQRVQEW